MERISQEQMPKGLYACMLNTEGYLKKAGIDPKIYHLVKIRASMINGCGYCIDMHTKEALKDGEDPKRLYLAGVWREAPCYSDKEKAALHFAEATTQVASSDLESAYRHVASHFSPEEIANLTLLICQINSWNRIAITFGYEPGSYQG